MPFPLIPAAVVALAGAGVYVHKKRKPKKMSAEQEKIYSAALKTLKDTAKLRGLADTYQKEGFKHEADMLRKRAALRELPPETKKARKAAFKAGLQSKDPVKVNRLAEMFHKEGAVGVADKLRQYAKGLITPTQGQAAPPK